MKGMIPAGYMAKRVVKRPEWIKSEDVEDVYSVSGCLSEDFAEYINYWKHNGFWFFDAPSIIGRIVKENSIDMGDVTLFYYEVYGKKFHEDAGQWIGVELDRSFTTNVVLPPYKKLEGFDVVSFFAGTNPGCSPLSCNNLAKEIGVNRHCLLPSLEKAIEALEKGFFNDSEPGPFKVFAVYTVDWF